MGHVLLLGEPPGHVCVTPGLSLHNGYSLFPPAFRNYFSRFQRNNKVILIPLPRLTDFLIAGWLRVKHPFALGETLTHSTGHGLATPGPEKAIMVVISTFPNV